MRNKGESVIIKRLGQSGEVMKEKIQVLNLEIDNLTAKGAMQRVMSYITTEPVSVVEMITMNTLGKFQQDEAADELFKSFELALAGDKGLLEAAGVMDEQRLKETGELLFIKMVMRFLHKNSVRVFLLAESETDLDKMEEYLREDYPHIQVMDGTVMQGEDVSDDLLLNLVNGAEAEWVLSVLPSPMEERFIFKNKALVNARVWLGLGDLLDELKREKNNFQKVRRIILRRLLKREMKKKGEKA